MSLKYTLANGEAEAAVKTAESTWRKNKDMNKALREYRATPIQGINLSPSQFSMGRRLRTTLPIACGLLELEAHNIKKIRERMKNDKDKLKYYHDRRGTKELPPLWPSIQGYTQLYTTIQSYKQLYKAIHSYTGLYTTIQSYRGLHTAIQGYTQL